MQRLPARTAASRTSASIRAKDSSTSTRSTPTAATRRRRSSARTTPTDRLGRRAVSGLLSTASREVSCRSSACSPTVAAWCSTRTTAPSAHTLRHGHRTLNDWRSSATATSSFGSSELDRKLESSTSTTSRQSPRTSIGLLTVRRSPSSTRSSITSVTSLTSVIQHRPAGHLGGQPAQRGRHPTHDEQRELVSIVVTWRRSHRLPRFDRLAGHERRRREQCAARFSDRATEPDWSPDGTRIAFTAPTGTTREVFTMNTSGGDVQQITTDGGFKQHPDWQPLPVNTPSTHVLQRPPRRSTSRWYGPTPPAPHPNRVHAAPLSIPTCSPPQHLSPTLTVGVGDGSPAFSRSVGSVLINALPGIPGGIDDADVRVRLSITNVMRKSDLSDYTGELGVDLSFQLTDREGSVSQTSILPPVARSPLHVPPPPLRSTVLPVQSTRPWRH